MSDLLVPFCDRVWSTSIPARLRAVAETLADELVGVAIVRGLDPEGRPGLERIASSPSGTCPSPRGGTRPGHGEHRT